MSKSNKRPVPQPIVISSASSDGSEVEDPLTPKKLKSKRTAPVPGPVKTSLKFLLPKSGQAAAKAAHLPLARDKPPEPQSKAKKVKLSEKEMDLKVQKNKEKKGKAVKPKLARSYAVKGQGQGRAGGAGQAWTEKYAPRTRAELAVWPKTVAAIDTWLGSAGPGAVLLLRGVCGAGKTAAVRLLAGERGLALAEAPARLAALLAWLAAAAAAPDLTQAGPRLLLLEELPVLGPTDPPLLRAALSAFMAGHARLVWIYSDPYYQQSDIDRLLGPLAAAPGLTVITVRPVSARTTARVVRAICAAEHIPVPAVEARAGDLRHVINSLQFQPALAPGRVLRDVNAHLFSALGRILYNKRGPDGAPQDQPEELRARLHLPQAYFTAFLHENAPDMLTDIQDLADIAEHLSLANVLEAADSYKATLEPYHASISTRACYLFNRSPAPRALKTFHKPKAVQALATAQDRLSQIPTLFFVDNRFPFSGIGELCTVTLPLSRLFFNFWEARPAPGTRLFLDQLTNFGHSMARVGLMQGEMAPDAEAADRADSNKLALNDEDGTGGQPLRQLVDLSEDPIES